MISIYYYLVLAITEPVKFCMDPVAYIIWTALTASAIMAVLNLIEQARKNKEVNE